MDLMRRPTYGDQDFLAAYGAAWGDAETLVSFYAENGQYTDMASGVTVRGHPMLRRFMKVYLGFSPKCIVKFTSYFAHDGGFVAEWQWTGNNDGPLRLHGLKSPENGSSFSVDGICTCKVDGEGRILSHVDYWDAVPFLVGWKAA